MHVTICLLVMVGIIDDRRGSRIGTKENWERERRKI